MRDRSANRERGRERGMDISAGRELAQGRLLGRDDNESSFNMGKEQSTSKESGCEDSKLKTMQNVEIMEELGSSSRNVDRLDGGETEGWGHKRI